MFCPGAKKATPVWVIILDPFPPFLFSDQKCGKILSLKYNLMDGPRCSKIPLPQLLSPELFLISRTPLCFITPGAKMDFCAAFSNLGVFLSREKSDSLPSDILEQQCFNRKSSAVFDVFPHRIYHFKHLFNIKYV